MIAPKELQAKDPNISVIARVAHEVCGADARVILFGSRARGEAREDSDYDVLVVLADDTDLERIVFIRTTLLNKLGKLLIPTDLIVETNEFAEKSRTVFWTVIHEALKEGIEL